jgi:hypothetical protein
LLIPYIFVVVVVTACLLGYNEFHVTEFGDYSLIIIDEKSLEPDFSKGDLVIVKRNEMDDIKIGDGVFFYDTYEEQVDINLGSVTGKVKVNDDEYTFTMSGDYEFSSQYIIGKVDSSKIYHGLGSVLSFLESRWVFLLVVILPILLIFIYEIYAFILEVKNSLKK